MPSPTQRTACATARHLRTDAMVRAARRLLCTGLLFGLPLAAAADDSLRADCDATTHFRVLARSDLPAEAAAIWLDAERLRWPQAPTGADIVLLHADTTIRLDGEGRPDEGVAQLALRAATEAVSPAQQQRFAWFGEGAEFAPVTSPKGHP